MINKGAMIEGKLKLKRFVTILKTLFSKGDIKVVD